MKNKILAFFLVCAIAVTGTSTVARAFDDNDETMETATEITMGDSIVGENELALDTSGSRESYDVDCYKFTLDKEQWVNLTVTPHYDGLSYTVIGSDGYTQLARDVGMGPEAEGGISEKLAAGTYYVEIKATWPNRTGKYTIALSNKGAKFDKTPLLFQADTNAKRTKINLSWDEVDEADGYIVYQFNKNTKKFKKIKTTKKTKATVTNLKTETEYRFKVTAYIKVSGKLIEGEPTEVRSVWTNPKKPGSTKITGITKGDKTTADGYPVRIFTLKWDKAKDATGYYVYGKVGAEDYKLLETTSVNEAYLYAGVGFSYKLYVVPYRSKHGYTTKGEKSAVYTTQKMD
ncbi:MAG: fibronectin type III domain-containing protein [Lachnospiraceae bacterium]|nr:fibronectin type III domain-containing protein [Lachnospiraceae bacterium]